MKKPGIKHVKRTSKLHSLYSLLMVSSVILSTRHVCAHPKYHEGIIGQQQLEAFVHYDCWNKAFEKFTHAHVADFTTRAGSHLWIRTSPYSFYRFAKPASGLPNVYALITDNGDSYKYIRKGEPGGDFQILYAKHPDKFGFICRRNWSED